MMQFAEWVLVYAAPLLVIWLAYLGLRQRANARTVAARDEAIASGLNEPPSLHPKIDLTRCMGCGSCVTACPEGDVLGIINGKSELILPSECIGHGACRAACPYDAITLVFGTETRGVEIPHVDGNFQTNVPGLFIAGELGGMGLIRNAIEQGRQSMEAIRNLDGIGQGGGLDVIIVGAGPAGIAASLAAKSYKLRYGTLEQDSLGGTVAHFPRRKLVMTRPAELPLAGRMNFTEVYKEELLEFWTNLVREQRLRIRFGERVEAVRRTATGFEVRTGRGTYRSRAVLLAIGRRGTPRRLNVPGEERSKVVYRLTDPGQYAGQHVLVVGGGDSALEAAGSIALETGAKVTLSYRSEAFSRAKPKNRSRVDEAAKSGRLRLMLKSQVTEIGESHVDLDCDGKQLRIKNDAVIVCAGGILPTNFLKSIGVEIETRYGTA
jgi:thioredoxin reductase/Pyruvate/2-oxoacid:ferredoxin oxidoreductase delta subunit